MSPGLGQVLDFMRLLWAVDHGLQSASKRMRARLGVTGLQRLVVRIVGRFPGISAGSLAAILHLHPSTLTGVLRRLQLRGDLERRRDAADGRRARFRLTARGRRLDAARGGTVEAAVRRGLSKAAPGDLEAAQRLLRLLAEALLDGGRATGRAASRRG
jgi:DNA-binding MarR family transcriptional regulator